MAWHGGGYLQGGGTDQSAQLQEQEVSLLRKLDIKGSYLFNVRSTSFLWPWWPLHLRNKDADFLIREPDDSSCSTDIATTISVKKEKKT